MVSQKSSRKDCASSIGIVSDMVWSNLKIAVESAGGSLEDIVKTTTYVVGADTGAKIRAARVEMLPEHGRPTSTTVAVAGLADPDFLVEVEAIAVIGDG